ncbi:MAG: iron-sulfur cluster assembly protein [Bacteroidales bacterium]
MEAQEPKTIQDIETEIISVLKTIYDPEIPVNIYDLGLIYKIDIDLPKVDITMTLTSPNCPMTDVLMYQIENRLQLLEEIDIVNITITFDPPWDKDMISEEGKLNLGFL